MLRVECPKCGRSGRYRLADLLMRYDRDEKEFAFTDDVIANCARRHGAQRQRSLRRDLPRSAEGALKSQQRKMHLAGIASAKHAALRLINSY
jgi:hypothetical protein